jgi:hypothetical protein
MLSIIAVVSVINRREVGAGGGNIGADCGGCHNQLNRRGS